MKGTACWAVVLILFLGFAAVAQAETCEYDTRWGVVVMSFTPSSVIGHYPHRNGNISGNWTGRNRIEGSWYQNDGNGYFLFNLHPSGFTGKWRYTRDRKWRGNWDGQLRGCF